MSDARINFGARRISPEAKNYFIVLSAFALTVLASVISIRLFAWIEKLTDSIASKKKLLSEE